MSVIEDLRNAAQAEGQHWELGDAVARRLNGDPTPERVFAAVKLAGRSDDLANRMSRHFRSQEEKSKAKAPARKAKAKA